MATTQVMSFAEFEQLPERSERGSRYELRHGELVQVPPPLQGHSRVQWQLRRLFEQVVGDRGAVHTEVCFRALPEGEFRIADVAFISAERWNGADPGGYLMGAPDLVVEVLSPSNTAAEMLDKEQLCLRNGSKQFWLVDMKQRLIKVTTSDGQTAIYGSGQQIPVFGATIDVDSVFA